MSGWVRRLAVTALHPEAHHLAIVVVVAAATARFWHSPLSLLVVILPAAAFAATVKTGFVAWDVWQSRRQRKRETSGVRFAAPVHLPVGDEPEPPDFWHVIQPRIQAEHPDARVTFQFTCRFGAHERDCQDASVGLFLDQVQVSMCRRIYLIDPRRSTYTLAHEAAHVTGVRLPVTVLLGPVSLTVALLVGLLMPGLLPLRVVAVHGLYMASLWLVELSCDVAAQHLVGREAAVRCWALSARAVRRLPRHRRLYRMVVLATRGTHPPHWLRLRVARWAPAGGFCWNRRPPLHYALNECTVWGETSDSHTKEPPMHTLTRKQPPVPDTAPVIFSMTPGHHSFRRHQDRFTLTPGVIDEEALELFGYAKCHMLAFAIHEHTGWPLLLVQWWDDDAKGWQWVHVGVKTPDGLLLDINGARHPGTVCRELGDNFGLSRVHEVTYPTMKEVADRIGYRVDPSWSSGWELPFIEVIHGLAHKLIKEHT